VPPPVSLTGWAPPPAPYGVGGPPAPYGEGGPPAPPGVGGRPLSVAALLSIGGSAAAGGGPGSGRGGDAPPRLIGGAGSGSRSRVLTASLSLGLRVAGGGQSTAWSSDVICTLLGCVQWVMLPWGGLLEHLSAACAMSRAGSDSQSDCAGSAAEIGRDEGASAVAASGSDLSVSPAACSTVRPGCRPCGATGGCCIIREQHGPRCDVDVGCVVTSLLVIGDWDAGGGGLLKSVLTGLGSGF
jgi:hypothetical protein